MADSSCITRSLRGLLDKYFIGLLAAVAQRKPVCLSTPTARAKNRSMILRKY
jgi:hypothetical protein